MEQKTNSSRIGAFVIITILFFLWGAITSVNDVLIDTYKGLHGLTDLQSMFILLAFFGAYGIGSLTYYLYSQAKGDPINRLGYKRGMLVGLLVSGIGCISLYPVTALDSYAACLGSFFVIGLGLTLLQITCNPYVAILGTPQTASSRLNLSQGFNSLGTTIGPLLAGYIILTYSSKVVAIQDLYLYCGLIFFAFAFILSRISLPRYESEVEATNLTGSAFNFSHLRAGMLAIFFYVGAEVMIGGKLIEYVQLPEIGGLSKADAASYLGIYWGGAMIGRLSISIISGEKFSPIKKALYGLLTIIATYLFIVLAITLKTKVMEQGQSFGLNAFSTTLMEILPISGFIAVQYIFMLVFRQSSRKLLSSFALLIIANLIAAYLFQGEIALWCMLSIGLFNSIMWSNIFTLSIEGLGDYTSQGSSLLIIMIIGGAILPLGMGWLSDHFADLKIGYLFPIISYLYIFYFGLVGSKRN